MITEVVIPEDGVVQGVWGLLRLPPFLRGRALALATDEEFLEIEPLLRAEKALWPELCAAERIRRGL